MESADIIINSGSDKIMDRDIKIIDIELGYL